MLRNIHWIAWFPFKPVSKFKVWLIKGLSRCLLRKSASPSGVGCCVNNTQQLSLPGDSQEVDLRRRVSPLLCLWKSRKNWNRFRPPHAPNNGPNDKQTEHVAQQVGRTRHVETYRWQTEKYGIWVKVPNWGANRFLSSKTDESIK